MLYLCSFDLRNPEAMRAATKEVQSVLETDEESISLDGKHISLNRKQLDNMPILGITILCRIILCRNHTTNSMVFYLLPCECLLQNSYEISKETVEQETVCSLATANTTRLPNVPGSTESTKIHMNSTFSWVMACLNNPPQLHNLDPWIILNTILFGYVFKSNKKVLPKLKSLFLSREAMFSNTITSISSQ